MTLLELQKSCNVPDFKGLLATAKERNFTDDYLASFLGFLFKVHETNIMRSLSRTIEYQQLVINTLIDVEDKDKFIDYVNRCIEEGKKPHSLTITNWDEFFGVDD